MYLKSLGYQQNVKTNGVVIEKYNNIPLHATDPSERSAEEMWHYFLLQA